MLGISQNEGFFQIHIWPYSTSFKRENEIFYIEGFSDIEIFTKQK